MSDLTCGLCRYWADGEGTAAEGYGACRRHAPTVLGKYPRGVWPLTHLKDWCGEGEPTLSIAARLAAEDSA